MTDDEIASALGSDTLDDETAQADSAIPVDSDGIIDVDFTVIEDASKDAGVEMPSRPLPAVIPAQAPDSAHDIGRDWSKSAVPERRCVAHKKDGEQCKNAAIKGARVCRYHGGATKHIKAAARARIENAQDLLAKQLLGMAIDDDIPSAVKLSAIKDALDRGGLRAPTEVVLSPGQTPAYEEVFDGIYSGSRDDSRAARTQSIDSQQDWSQSESLAQSTRTPPAPAMDAGVPEQASPFVDMPDSDRPPAPHADEPHRPRPSQRVSRQNRSHGYSGVPPLPHNRDDLPDLDEYLDQYLSNVENLRNAIDPPALPPGHSHSV